jgi:hypothetical protein
VREAEKSTLIFNLDLGKVPILNANTISKRATLALATMAAKVENSNSTLPTQDSVSAIDDILSVTKGMTFYGSVTKTYKNPKDKASGSFCTIPIRYECNLNCNTPYHPALRECIRQTSEFFRGVYNTSYVRVNVDSPKMVLRVFYKPDKDSKWLPHDKLIPIPKEALDLSTRKPPASFKMSGLIPANEPMDTLSSPGGSSDNVTPGSSSAHISRKDNPGKSPPKNNNEF